MNYFDRSEMSQSKMKILLESPRLFYKQYILGEKLDKKTDNKTISKNFGTCLDSALTEPEKYATFVIKKSATTIIEGCTTESWDNKIKIIIKDLYNYKINDEFFGGLSFKEIIQSCNKQQETYYTFKNIDWKMKTDYQCIDDINSFFIDIKSTKCTTLKDFIKDFYNYGYYLQASSYSMGLKIFHRLEYLPKAYYIGISTVTGEIFCILCNDKLISFGLMELDYGCQLYHKMINNNLWKKNGDIHVLDIPQWLENKIINLGL